MMAGAGTVIAIMGTAIVETTDEAMGIMGTIGTGHTFVTTTGSHTDFTTIDIMGMTSVIGMTIGAIGIDRGQISVERFGC
jgi:hypothetical protein